MYGNRPRLAAGFTNYYEDLLLNAIFDCCSKLAQLNRSGPSSDKPEISDSSCQPIAIVMNSATTLPDAASVPVRAPRLLGLYLLLIIIAAIEAFDGLSHAPIAVRRHVGNSRPRRRRRDHQGVHCEPSRAGAGGAGVRHRRPAALRDHGAWRARADDLAELHALGGAARARFSSVSPPSRPLSGSSRFR